MLDCLGVDVSQMKDPAIIPVVNPPDGRAELTLEHQDVEDLSPVCRCVLYPAGGEILRTGARHIFR